MLLRLLMPPYFRMIEGGTIVKWHKREGDPVEFGDDLFDVRVEQVRVTRTIKEPTAGDWLNRLTRVMKKQKGQELADAPNGAAQRGEHASQESAFKTWDAVVYFRVSSSDMGVLRRIHAKEEEYRQVGDLIAELTTAGNEPLDGGTEPVHASAFRIVANIVESNGHMA